MLLAVALPMRGSVTGSKAKVLKHRYDWVQPPVMIYIYQCYLVTVSVIFNSHTPPVWAQTAGNRCERPWNHCACPRQVCVPFRALNMPLVR